MTPGRWLRTAQILAIGIAVATPVVAVVSLTFGLVSGLVVVIVPAYLVAVWLAVAAIAVSVCMWRERRALARALGAVLALAPGTVAVALYTTALAACSAEADPGACRDYLDGSPLLRVGVALLGALGVGALVAVIALTAADDTQQGLAG